MHIHFGAKKTLPSLRPKLLKLNRSENPQLMVEDIEMQKTIKSFFKQLPICSNSNSNSNPAPQSSDSCDLFHGIKDHPLPQIRLKYTRHALDSSRHEETSGAAGGGLIGEENLVETSKSEVVSGKGKALNKKRSYAQFHLELGQSDFLLHACKLCGFKYSKGIETDEKVHADFHKTFTHGIPFKGWRRERVIDLPLLHKDKFRVIRVFNCDPLAQRNKVQEVVQMMEVELGDGWIFHDLCQVYLYVSSQRVAGCAVVEPIDTAYKVRSDSTDKVCGGVSRRKAIKTPTTLQFGEICFQREVSGKASSRRSSEALDSNGLGSIVIEEEATPASCGLRAIWVTPSNRRKQIATRLLDAVRKSFSTDGVLECSQLAFSLPTTTGKALALNYTGTESFLVYKAS